MSISKLSIFSKDTDANTVVKGYEYQKLKTLETWLSNKVNGVDEVIYCEYEDDIFQRNIAEGKSKFSQIKLYQSKAFSFKSEEIKKSLANFFMLFVKGEYSFDEVTFLFETNTSVAANRADNDADLLRTWIDRQEALDDDTLQRAVNTLRETLEEYVNEQFPVSLKQDKTAAQTALIEFKNLPNHVWVDFAKAIKWNFTNEESNVAIDRTATQIKEFIRQLPFPSVGDKLDTVFTTLYYKVSERTFQDEPENRYLTTQRLDTLILDLGGEADKQYSIAYNAWSDVTEIPVFRLSHFLEVKHSANHCRWSAYLNTHATLWLNLLDLYIHLQDTPDNYCLQALYEFLWLQLRPQRLQPPLGTIVGFNQYIERYFELSPAFDSHEHVEDHFSLLQIVRAAIVLKASDFDFQATEIWLKTIGDLIEQKLASVANPNDKCYWLELKAAFHMHPLKMKKDEGAHQLVFETFEQLVKLLPEAPLYNLQRLNDRTKQYTEILLEFEGTDDLVDRLEALIDTIMPFVLQRDGNHTTAKTYVERGFKYLHTTNPHHFAKALSYFHKAKDLWLSAETAEGYVLALLNIGQMCMALKMNLAARYYILSAAWFSINNNPEKLAKRIVSSFALLVHCDYQQGSWMSALAVFKYYAISRADFDPAPLDGNDKTLVKILVDIAHLMFFSEKVSPQLSGFVSFQKLQMGDVYTEYIEPLSEKINEQFDTVDWRPYLDKAMDAPPINDMGAERVLAFKAFGSTWRVRFGNDWHTNSIGEEFVAILQIFLVELSYADLDLHFIKTDIEIEIILTSEWRQPEQQPSHTHFSWKVYCFEVDEPDQHKIRFQMANVVTSAKYILREISLLKGAEFFDLVNRMFESEDLAAKTMTVNLYQRMERGLFNKKAFDDSQRQNFTPEIFPTPLKEDIILKWRDELSPLYSTEQSLEFIRGRVRNCLAKTQRTITHLKSQPAYDDVINDIRSKGWLDWQILLAIFNHVLNYKANDLIRIQRFESDDEGMDAFNEAFLQVKQHSEDENYIEFPLSYFIGPQFDFQLKQTAHLVVGTWGLENRSRFPNFDALRDFLNHRFNFSIDDLPELSPL